MSKLGLEYLKYIGKSPSDDSLIVDDVNDRVGIGTSAPGYTLDVATASGDAEMRLKTAGTGSGDHTILRNQIDGTTGSNYIFFGDSADSDAGFIRYNHSDNAMYFQTNAAERMRILSSGNIGIANTAPASELVVGGTIEASHVYSAGDIGLDATDKITFTDNTRMDITINNVNQFRFENDGDFHANGDVIAFSTTVSDERLKENIKLVDGALDKVKQLKGVTFNYTQDGKVSAGVIAQDVEKVLPEAVAEKKIPLKTDDGLLYKTVRYDALHSLLIEAIKELSAEVDELKKDR
jgi:hypothetical protein